MTMPAGSTAADEPAARPATPAPGPDRHGTLIKIDNLAHVRELVACAGNRAQLEVIVDANHFFAGQLETLTTAVAAFASVGPSSCQVGG